MAPFVSFAFGVQSLDDGESARTKTIRDQAIDQKRRHLRQRQVQVYVEQVQARCQAPIPQQAWLDVGERERAFEQCVVLREGMPHCKAVRCTSTDLHIRQGVGCQGVGHARVSGQDGVGAFERLQCAKHGLSCTLR